MSTKKLETQPVLVKTANLMQLFGVSRQTITNWRKRGMGHAAVKKGTWDLLKVVTFWAENVHYPEDGSITSHRERWEKARADKLEFELSELKRQHINIEDLQTVLTAFYLKATSAFHLLSQQASIDLEGFVSDMPKTLQYLEHATTTICDGLADDITVESIKTNISKTY